MNGRKRFIVLFLLIVVASVVYYYVSVDHSSDLVLIGTVDANQVIVSSQIQGRIQKLLVDEGTEVKAGDLIAVLDPEELEASRRAADATLRSLHSQVSATRYTERVTRGSTSSDVLNAAARLEAAQASLAESAATLAQTRLDTERTVKLAEQGVASVQDRDRALSLLQSQQAHTLSLRQQVHAAEQDLAAARARLLQTGAAESTVASTREQMLTAQAQKAQAETRLNYTKIYAPVSGYVSVRAAREGEVVNPGAAIVTIVDFGYTWAYAALPETYADHIRLGDELSVRMPGGSVVKGAVIFKAAEGDFATQRDVSRRKRDIKTVALKVRLDNTQRNLVPGMTAEVLIPKTILEGRQIAPAAAGSTTQPHPAQLAPPAQPGQEGR